MGLAERIRRLEARLPKPLVVIARMPDGSIGNTTAAEFVNTADADFIKVASGSNLRELDMILDSFGGII